LSGESPISLIILKERRRAGAVVNKKKRKEKRAGFWSTNFDAGTWNDIDYGLVILGEETMVRVKRKAHRSSKMMK